MSAYYVSKTLTRVMFAFAVSVSVCDVQVKNGMCWVFCRELPDGFEAGSYEEKSKTCLCSRRIAFKDVTDKTIKIQPVIKATGRTNDDEFE